MSGTVLLNKTPTSIMQDIIELASIYSAWQRDPAKALALVTLVEKNGSSYRQPGARMLVLDDETTIGSVSGGCLEGDLASYAKKMHENGDAFASKVVDTRPIFGCDGTITLFIENWSARREKLDKLMRAISEAIIQRKNLCLSTCFGAAGKELGTTLCDDCSDDQNAFMQRFGLRKRVVIVGAHADTKPLLNMVRALGWEAIQIIPGVQKNAWVCSDASVEVKRFMPREIVEQYSPDEATAVVIMTHNIGRDVEFVAELLQQPYAYIGMLGSRNRRNEVIDYLMTTGHESAVASMDRLHCPIGFDIGSETAPEIALSIVAEIKAVFEQRSGDFLKDKSCPIHPKFEF